MNNRGHIHFLTSVKDKDFLVENQPAVEAGEEETSTPLGEASDDDEKLAKLGESVHVSSAAIEIASEAKEEMDYRPLKRARPDEEE